MLKIASDGNLCLLVGEATVQSLYNTPCYNTDLDITQPCCGSLKKFTMEFYKGIIAIFL